MPYAKGNQSTRKNTREDTIREEDLEHESEPVARDVITSPLSSASSLSSASTYSSVSGSASSVGTGSAGSAVSSEQLEMILAANNRALADSWAANQRTMEASMTSLISTLSPAVPVSVAPTPAAAPSPPVKVPKWTDGDQPFAFFNKLETALTHNGVDKATWGRLLPVYLSGEAETAFVQVDRSLLGDYDAVKNVLLKALGDTPGHADRRWWSLARLPGETPAQFYLRIRNTGLRRLSDFPTREAVVDHTILSRFLSLLPADSYTAVTSQHPKTGLEAAELLQDFEETKAYSWKRQGWRNSHHSGRREHSRGGSGNSSGNDDGSSSSPNSFNGSNSGESGVSPTSGSNPGSGAEVKEVSSSDNFRGRRDRKANKPIICHGCGEPGHIRPQCPLRIRTVRSSDSVCSVKDDKMFVSGWIGGSPVERLKFDSGADHSLVRKDLVPPAAYTGKVVHLVTWKGNDPSIHKLAKVPIKVGKIEVLASVAVVEQLDCPALLGADLGRPMTRQLFMAVMANIDDDDDVSDEVPMQSDSSVNIEVPMQSDSSVNIEVPMQSDSSVDIEVPMQSDGSVNIEVACKAPPVALEDIFCFDDSLFEPEVACKAPPVALEDIFCFDDSLFEPEDACDAPTVVMDDIFSLSVFPFGPDLGGVEFPLPELTDVNDEVLEVLEASVAPVCCSNFVVPRHLEEVHDEVLEAGVAGVASVDSVEIVVPMQVVVKADVAVDWIAPADAVSDAVSDTVGDYFNLPEEFFVEDQADVVASGPVDCKPMVGLDVAVFVDCLSETDPVLAPVPVARPETETVVNFVILAMKDCIPPKLCWQSTTVLVDHCLRCTCCVTKATGKFAPGSCTVILMFDMFILVTSTICSFCSCISMCLSKFLVVLFFGAFGPRAVPLLPVLDEPPWRMLGAPSASWFLDRLGFSLWTSPLPLLLRPWVSRRGGRCYGVSLPCCSSSLTFSWHAS